ncbi:MAG: NAD(P)H-binding protein [Actinomycetota bacterium]|nr:NAD(P)H-binding protein [Actinomycetota bacterium]
MAKVLVTGGMGLLGSRLVPVLSARFHDVRVLSRHASPERVPSNVQAVVGDVRINEGLNEAVAGVDAVVHAATSPRRRATATEVEGTRHMLEAATRAGVPNFVYISIVGVGRHRFPYYQAKWAAEQLVEAAPGGWTIQRETQFHDLLDMFLGFPLFPSTHRMAFQPIDAGEVSERLAELIERGPSGRVTDLGGPEVLTVRQLCDARYDITSRRTRLLPVPRLGFLRDFDEGLQLAPDHKFGRITWSEWLSRRT